MNELFLYRKLSLMRDSLNNALLRDLPSALKVAQESLKTLNEILPELKSDIIDIDEKDVVKYEEEP
jgi:hypothetical protein